MISLRYPSHIIFGKGALSELADEVSNFGKEVLLVTGRTAMRRAGVLDKVCKLLSHEKIGVHLFDEVEHDPSLHTVRRGVEVVRRKKISVVIGLGGGSVIDAAKAIAIVAPKEEDVKRYYYGEVPIEGPGIPFIAVPTTAGTGAEITNNAVLTDSEKKIKKSLRSPFMVAKVAIVDPELTLFCSPFLTAYSGMDAFTQAVECFISRASNPVTDTLTLRAIEILYNNLPFAVQNGEDIEIREKVALGSLLQAMAFSNAGLGAAHGLSHPLGAHYNIPHGLACGVLLPYVLEANMCVCREKMDIIAEKLGAEKADDLPHLFTEFLRTINLPLDFKKWQIKKEDIPVLVRESKGGSMSKNPKDLVDEELSRILKKVI
ncbi:iron-containing alcohol dehydrogenase [Candidatus Aerophobetes bacterium]|nr:iron-containing alcohol dehydrogenase [Candidatus Aerophobetes bacterium]